MKRAILAATVILSLSACGEEASTSSAEDSAPIPVSFACQQFNAATLAKDNTKAFAEVVVIANDPSLSDGDEVASATVSMDVARVEEGTAHDVFAASTFSLKVEAPEQHAALGEMVGDLAPTPVAMLVPVPGYTVHAVTGRGHSALRVQLISPKSRDTDRGVETVVLSDETFYYPTGQPFDKAETRTMERAKHLNYRLLDRCVSGAGVALTFEVPDGSHA